MSSTFDKTGTTPARKIPAIMQRRDPKDVATANNKVDLAFGRAPDKVTGAVANEVEGQCPVCKTQMRIAQDNGINCWVCMTHRIVMPVRDEETTI